MPGATAWVVVSVTRCRRRGSRTSPSRVTAFAVATAAGSAADFHARVLGDDVAPEVWVFDVARPTLVVGSAQRPEDVADLAACAAAGVDVVRRRSGGARCCSSRGALVWFDVVVPTAHLQRRASATTWRSR